MTIIAGFHTTEGIVLAADTQETVGDYIKRSQPKLVFRPNPATTNGPRALFGGAGNGDLIDHLVDIIWNCVASAGNTLDEVVASIRAGFLKEYEGLARCYHQGYMPEAEFLLGIWLSESDVELLRVCGPLVIRNLGNETIGCGTVLSTYISNRIYHRLTFQDALAFALFIIDEAKVHVSGCGGNTNVYILNRWGKIIFPSTKAIVKRVEEIRAADGVALDIFGTALNPELDADSFEAEVTKFLEQLRSIRRLASGKSKPEP